MPAQQVRDVKTGAVILVDDGEAKAGLASGIYEPAGKVVATTTTGDEYAVEAGDVATLGLTEAGPEAAARAAQQAADVERYGDSGLSAFGTGVGLSASLGLSALGGTREDRAERGRLVRTNPGSTMAGQLAGDLVLGAATSAPGAIGKAASLLPGGAVSRASERLVAGGLAGSRVAGAVAGGALEGAAGAAADYLAQEALSDRPELSGEAFAAHLGVGSLLGGAIGGGLGTVGGALERRAARRQAGALADEAADTTMDVERAAMGVVDDLAAESDRVPLASLVPPRAATPEGVAERVSGVYGALRQADAERVALQREIDDTVMPGLDLLEPAQAQAVRGELGQATAAYKSALDDAKGWARGASRQQREVQQRARQEAQDAQRAIRSLDVDARADVRLQAQQERQAMQAIRSLEREGKIEAKAARQMEREAARMQKLAAKAPAAETGAVTARDNVTVADLLAASRKFGGEVLDSPSVSPTQLSLYGVINETGELIDGNHRAGGLRAWAGSDPERLAARVPVVRTRDAKLVRSILDAKDQGRDNIDDIIDAAFVPDQAAPTPRTAKRTPPAIQPDLPDSFANSKLAGERTRWPSLPAVDDVDEDGLYVLSGSDAMSKLRDANVPAEEIDKVYKLWKKGKLDPPSGTMNADGTIDMDVSDRAVIAMLADEGEDIAIRLKGTARSASTLPLPDSLMSQLQRTQDQLGTGRALSDVSAEGAAALPKRAPRGRQPKMPAGFEIGPNISPTARRIKGIPDLPNLDEDALYVVKASDLRARGQRGLVEGVQDGRKASIQRGWKDGKSFEPIDATVYRNGEVEISQGRHRLMAAAEEGRDIPVRFSRAFEEPTKRGKEAVSEWLAKYKRDTGVRYVDSATGAPTRGVQPRAVDKVVSFEGQAIPDDLPAPIDLASFRGLAAGERAERMSASRALNPDIEIPAALAQEREPLANLLNELEPMDPGTAQVGRMLDGDSDDAVEVFARLDEAAEAMRRAVAKARSGQPAQRMGAVSLPDVPAGQPGIARKIAGVVQNIGSALEVGNALGVPVPSAGQIPVVGPALSSYLKLRAAWRALRGSGAMLPATASARAASAKVRMEAGARAAADRVLQLGDKALRSTLLPGMAARQGGRLADRLLDGEAEQREIQAEIDEVMSADPTSLQMEIARSASGAPLPVTAGAQEAAARAIAYLQEVAPKPAGYGTPWAQRPRYSTTEIAQWRQRRTAVRQPEATAAALAGGLVAPWAREAVVRVWPQIWALYREELSRQQDVLAKLSRPQRMSIGRNYDLVLDPSRLPGYLTAASVAASKAQAGAGGAAPTRSAQPSSKPRIAELMATPEQATVIQ